MSTGLSGFFNSSAYQNATNTHIKPINAALSYNQLASSSGTSSISTHNAPPPTVPIVNPFASLKKGVNSRRTQEEIEIIQETAERVRERLAQDQTAVLHPDVDSPFMDELDVINRLLPYHVFQQPRDDLERIISGKGKEKAVDDAWKVELRETKFALECYKRRQKIVDRWRKVLINSGKRASPDDQSYFLAQLVLDADRAENTLLANELRTTRSQVERLEREKRATTTASRVSQFPSTPQAVMPTMQAQYYRTYPYAYTQAYGSAVSLSTPIPSSAPTPTVATPTTYSPYLPNGAIPVQLPVASLPALHALGIVPVPAASLPPEGQPQAAAVLRGSTANGTILNLEINVSLLHSTQMTGLAMVLNSLVARTQNVAAVTANAATAAGSTQSNGSNTVAVKVTDSNTG